MRLKLDRLRLKMRHSLEGRSDARWIPALQRRFLPFHEPSTADKVLHLRTDATDEIVRGWKPCAPDRLLERLAKTTRGIRQHQLIAARVAPFRKAAQCPVVPQKRTVHVADQ